jgi:large subunit ribosomal protein L29
MRIVGQAIGFCGPPAGLPKGIEMKADKIRELDNNDLMTQERETREQMFRLRFQLTMGQTDGLKKLRLLKKDRARMLTTLRQRELNPELIPAAKTTKAAKTSKKKGK